MVETCSHCHNAVEGKFTPSGTRRFLTGLAKKGGMKAVLAYVGSVVPGIGNIGGFLAGGVVDFIYGDDIKKFIDKVADIFDDNKVYVFDCPNCGNSWARKEDEINSSDYDELDDEEKEQVDEYIEIFEKVKEIIADKLSIDEDDIEPDSRIAEDLGADSLDAVELVMEMEKEYGIKVPDEQAEHIRTVWDIVSYIGGEIIEASDEDDDDDDDYDDDDDDSSYERMMLEKLLVNPNVNLIDQPFIMPIEDVFNITGRGVVVTGRILTGIIKVGDKVIIRGEKTQLHSIVTGVEMFRKLLDQAEAGDNCGLLLRGVNKEDIVRGMIVYPDGLFIDTNSEEAKVENKSSEQESEYIEELRACLEDGEISRGERRLLEKLRVKLGISESRAAEIEKSLRQPMLSEAEQEYLDEYRECLADGGGISSGERRLLNRLRVKLGISEQRATELENL